MKKTKPSNSKLLDRDNKTGTGTQAVQLQIVLLTTTEFCLASWPKIFTGGRVWGGLGGSGEPYFKLRAAYLREGDK
jgi:hypothetical protein